MLMPLMLVLLLLPLHERTDPDEFIREHRIRLNTHLCRPLLSI
jgi:hypothetical protein